MENKSGSRHKIWAAGIGVIFCVLGVAGILYAVRGRSYGPERFDAFVDELFKEEATANTINLHYTLAYPEKAGIDDYKVSLGSFSVEDFEKSLAEMEELVEELQKFDVSRLSGEQKLTYDILMDYAQTELSAKDLILYTEILGPTTGYQAQLPVVLAEYTFRTRRDIEDYLVLVSQIDEMAEEIIAFEKEKAQAGLFMSDDTADAVIGQCSEFIAQPEENYMIEVFDDKIDAFPELSEEEREAYKEKNHAIITTEVTAGYQTLIDGLTELKGNGVNELGLCYYEHGKEYYEYLVRSGTGSDDSIKQLLKRTEKFMEDYFQKIQEALLKDMSLYDRLVSYEFPDMEPEEIIEKMKSEAEKDFPKAPEAGYTVKHVHPSMQENMSPAFYLTSPVDDIQDNFIYINDKYLDTDESMGADLHPTLAHEGYPGHLYQNIYTASCNLPLIRNLLSYTGYTEGWATYVEMEYSYDYTGMDETLADLLSGDQAFSLALSSYLDMKIHYDGWDKEDVGAFLSSLGIGDDEIVDELFGIIVEEPANYLSYFIGYLEFLELKDKAQKTLGDAFDQKAFHQFVLETGPAPFYIIEDYMKEGIEK